MQKKAPALRSKNQKKRPGRSAKGRDQNHREPVADAISALANAIATERKADRKQQHRSERGKSFREWATIILLFVTAGFVLGQLREMQKVYGPIAEQARYTRESYAAVQRAFVGDIRLTLDPEEDKEGKPISWKSTITVENSGSTPTKDLEYVSMAFKRIKDIPSPDKWFDIEPDFGMVLRGTMTIGPKAKAEIMVPAFSYFPAVNEKYPDGAIFVMPAGKLMGCYTL